MMTPDGVLSRLCSEGTVERLTCPVAWLPVQPWKKPNPKFEKPSGSTLPDCAKMAYRFRFQQAKSSMLKLPHNVRPAGRAKEH